MTRYGLKWLKWRCTRKTRDDNERWKRSHWQHNTSGPKIFWPLDVPLPFEIAALSELLLRRSRFFVPIRKPRISSSEVDSLHMSNWLPCEIRSFGWKSPPYLWPSNIPVWTGFGFLSTQSNYHGLSHPHVIQTPVIIIKSMSDSQTHIIHTHLPGEVRFCSQVCFHVFHEPGRRWRSGRCRQVRRVWRRTRPSPCARHRHPDTSWEILRCCCCEVTKWIQVV